MAKVLSLKDENAYVCYTELNSDEGEFLFSFRFPLLHDNKCR